MVVVPAVVLIPALTGRDSFPISTYPMYAFRRGPVERFPAVLGIDAGGAMRPLPIDLVADSNDPLIAEALIEQAIRSGAAIQLCEQVADRLPPEMVRVLVVEEVHDVVDRLQGRASLRERVVHAECSPARQD